MKHIFLAILFLISKCAIKAQSLEDKITERSCECMKIKPTFVDSVMIRCILVSMDEVAKADSTGKYHKTLSNTDNAIKMLKKVHERLLKTCKDAIMKPKEGCP
jgi:hypothetical protein